MLLRHDYRCAVSGRTSILRFSQGDPWKRSNTAPHISSKEGKSTRQNCASSFYSNSVEKKLLYGQKGQRKWKITTDEVFLKSHLEVCVKM